jgi:hypothetical protein
MNSLGAFKDLRLENLIEYARKWVEGPYDPSKRGVAWKVPIKTVSLYKPILSRGPGGYIIVFELSENEDTLTYWGAKQADWDSNLTRREKIMSAHHAEIDKLLTACGMYSTIIDEGPGSLRSFLIDKDFVRLVYKPEIIRTIKKNLLQDEWRFHVLFTGEDFPEWIDNEGPFQQLYPIAHGEEKEGEHNREARSIATNLSKHPVMLPNAEPSDIALLAKKGLAFTHGSKSDRLDNLGKAMKKALNRFIKEKGTEPTAFELYDWIPESGTILEKEPDTQRIHWKRANDTETSTSFKSFQNRYTSLKKKLTSK